MSCSFRGATSSSVSLEIQWWYTRHSRDWAEQPALTTNQVIPQENTPMGANKISVVKVVGSNISHKLRLSSVKPSDEGTYECRVIDFSESRAQQHRVQAYLQVQQKVHSSEQLYSDQQQKEVEKTTSEQKAGPEDHQEEAVQRTQQAAHRFHKGDHHQLNDGNKTRAGKKHQSETQ